MTDVKQNQHSDQSTDRRSKSVSKRTRMVISLIEYLNKSDHFLHVFFFLFSLGLFSGLISSFRLLVVYFFLGISIVQLKVKNIFLSIVPLLIFGFQFIGPNKYYFVEAIPKEDILEVFFSGGYYLGYGVSLPNILIALALVLFIREIIISKKINFLWNKEIIFLLTCCAIFIITALYALLHHSPFQSLSLIWTLQYAQLFSVAVVCIYALKTYKSLGKELLLIGISWSAFFQGCVVVAQFLQQQYVGFSFELVTGSSFYTGADENNALFRPAGSFIYNNQASLILGLMLSILLPFALHTKKMLYFLASFFLTIAIILIQTRSIWITTAVTVLWLLFIQRKKLMKLFEKLGHTRMLLYFLAGALTLGPIILPRILLSTNFFYRGAGLPIRIDMLSEAISVIASSFWVGYGPGTIEYITHQLFPEGVTRVFPAPVHNGYLHLMIEVGFIGLLAFLLPFLLALRKIKYRKILKPIQSTTVHSVAYMLGCFVFMFYYIFLSHSGTVEFAYLGILLGIGYSENLKG